MMATGRRKAADSDCRARVFPSLWRRNVLLKKMKIIKNKGKDGKYTFCSFEFNECYRPGDCPSGTVILYTLAKNQEIQIKRILIDYWSDIHSGVTRDTYSPKLFGMAYPSFESFRKEMENAQSGPWLIILTDGTTLSGRNGTVINVRTESNITRLTKLLMRAEDMTYELHGYPPFLIRYLCDMERMSVKTSVLALERLSAYPELYREFCGCLQSREFVSADKPVKIQGYTAERLIEELGLHPIGAYKTLAALCDDPSGTLELIKRGIIKK